MQRYVGLAIGRWKGGAMMDAITCAHCGGEIGPHWQLFAHEPVCQAAAAQQADFRARHRHLEHRMADRRLLNTGIIVRRAEG
jgi:hypothetical protein